MRKYAIETLEEWNKLAARLRERGYSPWSYQFGHWSPEGLHVWFGKPGKDDVEIITNSEEVHKAIYKVSKPSK